MCDECRLARRGPDGILSPETPRHMGQQDWVPLCAHVPITVMTHWKKLGTMGCRGSSKNSCPRESAERHLIGKWVCTGIFSEGPRDEITLHVGGPKPNGWFPYKEKGDTDREEKPCEDRGRDGRDAATSPGTLGALRGWTRQPWLYPGTLQVVWPFRHLDFSLLIFWTTTEYIPVG